MTNEQIAHDLSVVFADRMLREQYPTLGEHPDYIGAAHVLTSEYGNIYPEILGMLSHKDLR